MKRLIEKGFVLFILGIGVFGGFNVTSHKAAVPIGAFQVVDKVSVFYNDTVSITVTTTSYFFETIINLSLRMEVPEELRYESYSATNVIHSSDNHTCSYSFDQIDVGETVVISTIFRVISREVKTIEFKPSNISFQLLNGLHTFTSTNSTEINLKGVEDQLSEPSIIFPNSSTIKGPIIVIEWVPALDTLDHNVTYSIHFSSNYGGVWTELIRGIATTSYSWNTTNKPNGLSYLIKVIATCSSGKTSEAVSDTLFTIENESSRTKTTTPTTTPGMIIIVLLSGLMMMSQARKSRFIGQKTIKPLNTRLLTLEGFF